MKDGILCLTYRAANAFNANILGRAVIASKLMAVTLDQRELFYRCVE